MPFFFSICFFISYQYCFIETKTNYFEKVKVLIKQNMEVALPLDPTSCAYPYAQCTSKALVGTIPDALNRSRCELDLGSTYLVNCLKFKIVSKAYCDDSMCYSYTLRFSINSEDWMTLADYSKYSCYKEQSLYFPVQAMR